MKITFEETGAYSYALNIEASAEELAENMETALRRYRNTADVEGFRPGRVPMEVVRKLYGEQIAEDAAEDFVQGVFEELVERSPQYRLWEVSEELTHDYTYGGDLTARILFAVRPAIAIKDFEGERLEVPVAKKTQAMVDEATEALLWNYGTYTPLPTGAALQDGDVITYVARLLRSDDGEQAGEWEPEVRRLVLGEDVDAFDGALKQVLIGAPVGAKVRFSVRDRFWEDEPQTEDMLHFEATVRTADRITPAELTSDLSRRVLPAAGGTVKDLRDWVSRMVDARQFSVQITRVESCIKKRLLELHDLVAPELVVRQYALESLEEDAGALREDFALDDLPPPFANSLLWLAERRVKWAMLRESLLRKFKEELAPVDIQEDLEADFLALKMGNHFQNNGMEPESLESELLEDPDEMQWRAEDRALFTLLAGKFDVVFVAEQGE